MLEGLPAAAKSVGRGFLRLPTPKAGSRALRGAAAPSERSFLLSHPSPGPRSPRCFRKCPRPERSSNDNGNYFIKIINLTLLPKINNACISQLSIAHWTLASLCGNSLEVDAADVASAPAASATAAPPFADAVGPLGFVKLALEDGEKAADPEQGV